MKKLFCIYVAIMLTLLLSSCSGAQKAELEKLINCEVKEEIYTSASYSEYAEALKKSRAVMRNPFSSSAKVSDAQNNLQTAIDNLKIAVSGVYKLEYSFTLISNNSVGNDWHKTVKYNMQEIKSGDTITAALSGTARLNIMVVEDDKYPDVGKNVLDIPLGSETSSSAKITVREKRGQYSGNTAVWEFSCTAVLIERR